jgi:Tfp pilus assembly protein PilO
MNGNRLIAIVLGLLTVGVFALGWLLGVAPKLAEATASDAERQLVEVQNAASEAELVRLADESERLGELRKQLDKLAISIPGEHGLEDFLDQLAEAAAASGVVIDSVTTGEAAPPIVTAVEGEATTDTAADTGDLLSIPLTVGVSGPMPGVLAFSELVQTLPRLTLISALSVTDEAGTARGSLTGALFVIPELSTAP